MQSGRRTVERAAPGGTEAGFAGFGPQALPFLRDLAREQNRAWFEANRDTYEAALRAPLGALVQDLAAALVERGIPLRGDPKGAVFRIHRDVRFSRDKRPYKTNVGAALTRDGGKMSPGVLYVHVDPEGSFAAAGFYRPEPSALHAIRTALVARAAAWRKVAADLARNDLALTPDEDALRRPPRGFEAATDPDLAALLRRRSFTVRVELAPKVLAGPALVETVVGFAAASAPLLRFGWTAIEAAAA